MTDQTIENDTTFVARGLTTNKVIETIEIPIDKIEPAGHQPRTEFPSEGIQILANSISKRGLINPIIVRKDIRKDIQGVSDNFIIVAGERRWRACKYIGKETIKATVVEIDDFTANQYSWDENFADEKLTDVEEEARIYKMWIAGVKHGTYTTYTSMAEDTGLKAYKISASVTAYEQREFFRKFFSEEDFDRLTTLDMTKSIALSSDIEARAQLMKMKMYGIISSRELVYCCKILNDVGQNVRDTVIILLLKQEITSDQIPMFIKAYDIITPDIKDKLLDGEVTFDDALKIANANNLVEKTEETKGSKPIEKVNDNNDNNDVLKRSRFVYLEGIIALKANDISNIKNEEHQKTCIDFVQKIVIHCEDILSELGIAKE